MFPARYELNIYYSKEFHSLIRANAKPVPKFHVALLASYAALTM
jgi:hypothetical protein